MYDAVFLEYRFNPGLDDYDELSDRLNRLGFAKRSEHSVSGVEVWLQGRAIILVHPDAEFKHSGSVMGLGIISEDHPMDLVDNVVLDHDTDFYVRECDNGFRFYFAETSSLSDIYNTVDNQVKSSGIFCFSGLVWETTDQDMLTILSKVAEKVEQSDKYTKYIFNNKFTVFVNSNNNNGSKLIISDSQDVFATTSFLVTRDVDLLHFEQCIDDGADFGKLNHKIVGYNCRAFGNSGSYSIENYIKGNHFNTDILFRTRKQYVKIKEHTLDYYDEIVSQ